MKLNKVLIVVSVVTILPVAILTIASFVTHSVLIPSGICSEYNGNDFGLSAVCKIVPGFSYFGSMLMILGGWSLLRTLGLAALAMYFIRVYLYNKRQVEQKLHYSNVMKVMLTLVIISLLLSVVGRQQKISSFKKEKAEMTIPTETHFVCNENSFVDIWPDDTVVVVRFGEGVKRTSAVGDVDNELKQFKFDTTFVQRRKEFQQELLECENSNGLSIYDIYAEPQ